MSLIVDRVFSCSCVPYIISSRHRHCHPLSLSSLQSLQFSSQTNLLAKSVSLLYGELAAQNQETVRFFFNFSSLSHLHSSPPLPQPNRSHFYISLSPSLFIRITKQAFVCFEMAVKIPIGNLTVLNHT